MFGTLPVGGSDMPADNKLWDDYRRLRALESQITSAASDELRQSLQAEHDALSVDVRKRTRLAAIESKKHFDVGH